MQNALFVYYGIKPMSLEEELNQPKYAKQTRQNKMKIIGVCNDAKNLIENIEFHTKQAPELDNQQHAELVQELYNKVTEMYTAVIKACMVGSVDLIERR